jgi:hypothetical protein
VTTTTRRTPKGDTVLRALNVAVVHLDWLTGHDGGPDRYALALDILDDPTTLVRTDGDRAEDTGIRSKGGHSDPTGEAATPDPKLTICGQTRNASHHRRTLTDTAALIVYTADDLRQLAAAPFGYTVTHIAPTLPQARVAATWCLTVPHTVEAALAALADLEDKLELAAAVELLAEQTTMLQTTVAGILRTAAHPPTTKPKQKPINECTNCQLHGIGGTLAVSKVGQLCSECDWFRGIYKCQPGRDACRELARRGHGNARLSRQMIDDSRAESRLRLSKRKLNRSA